MLETYPHADCIETAGGEWCIVKNIITHYSDDSIRNRWLGCASFRKSHAWASAAKELNKLEEIEKKNAQKLFVFDEPEMEAS